MRHPALSRLLVALFTLPLVVPCAVARAEEPEAATPQPEITRGDLELAVTSVAEPLQRRLVLRNEQNQYDVWLVSKLDFEKAAETFRQAISTKRSLAGGLRVERWTWIEPDHSYVLDIAGGQKVYRVRLTRHLAGSLLELESAGIAQDAPRWAPPYRPRPVLLPHGVNR